MIDCFKKNEKNRKLNNKGFSLVEVILSMAILALITIPLLKYFTDSMKYSAKMATKQQAIVMAQQITEDMAGQEKLLKEKAETPGTYWIPYLENKLSYGQLSNSIDATGKGNIVYTKSDGNYDIEISISTNTPANSKERPLVYGIDNSKEVLAVEGGQNEEAITYFSTVNSSYVDSINQAIDQNNAANPGSDSRTKLTKLSTDVIRNNMSRKITINLAPVEHGVSANVSYTYFCDNLKPDETTEWVGTPLISEKYVSVNKIYLLYERLDAKNDEIVINSSLTTGEKPEVLIICQNPEHCDENYKITLSRLGSEQVIRTNISNTFSSTKTGEIRDPANASIDVKRLTEKGVTTRLLVVKTQIYGRNHLATDAPLAEIETTKGE